MALVNESRPLPNPFILASAPTMLIACVGRISLPVVDWSAEVRFEAWLCRDEDVAMSIGVELAMLVMIGSPKRGKIGSSKSHSSSVESTYELGLPAEPCALRCQENRRSFSFSFSDLRREGASKPRGVPTGVGSAVEVRSRSLVAGE